MHGRSTEDAKYIHTGIRHKAHERRQVRIEHIQSIQMNPTGWEAAGYSKHYRVDIANSSHPRLHDDECLCQKKKN